MSGSAHASREEARVPLALDRLSWGFTDPFGSGVTIEVAAGEALAVVGPNGAGKSTLLRTISGRLPVLAGSVSLGGAKVSELTVQQRAKRVAMLPQAPPGDPDLTVQELVELGRTTHLRIWGRLGKLDREAVEQALQWCGVASLAHRRLGEISGGERQRSRIAMTIAQGAPLLLLDEPTSHLDLRRRHELFELLAELRGRRSLALVFVLHDLVDAYREADRVLVVASGDAVEVPRQDEARVDKLAEAFGVPPDRIPL